MGRLNLLRPQHGLLCTHTQIKTHSRPAETCFLGHTRTYDHAQKSVKWCSRQTWWRLIPAKPLLSSAECQLSRESLQGLWLRFVAWVAKTLADPSPAAAATTYTQTHLPLPACQLQLKLLHGFLMLWEVSADVCMYMLTAYGVPGKDGSVILG